MDDAHPLLRRAAGALFGSLARLRGDRAFHPRGEAFEAQLELRAGGGLALMAPPLDRAGATFPALVRLSRAVGLPPQLPDVLGVAVRVTGLGGFGGPLDLLLASSLAGRGGYHLLMPARDFGWSWYSSVLPYRVGGRLVVLGALAQKPGAEGGRRFALAVAPIGGRLIPFADLRLGPPLAPREADALRFDPTNVAGQIKLAGGLLDPIRASAYEASRRAAPPPTHV